MGNLVGQSIGRYHIVEQLGEGGMATVYKAFDTRLERDVAIKVIRQGSIGQDHIPQMLRRFEREAKALAKFMHANIVPIIDYGEHEGAPFLVMAYLPGGTLKAKTGKAVDCRDAARLLLPVARALEYAHKRNIIHRDVKPANILITEEGEPMLSDFGIAKILELQEGTQLTRTGVGIGTPEYMAPEQWEGKVSPQTDIYALGVVFYELVTGRKPYIADTPAAVLRMQLMDPLPRPKDFMPGLPDNVEQCIFKALAKNPKERYEDMGTFADVLQKISNGGGLYAFSNEQEVTPTVREPQKAEVLEDERSLIALKALEDVALGLEAQSNLEGAVEAYSKALAKCPKGSPQAAEIERRMAALERRIEAEHASSKSFDAIAQEGPPVSQEKPVPSRKLFARVLIGVIVLAIIGFAAVMGFNIDLRTPLSMATESQGMLTQDTATRAVENTATGPETNVGVDLEPTQIETVPHTRPIKVINLINGVLGDKAVFDSADRGVKKAQEEFGLDVQTIEAGTDPEKWQPALEDAAANEEYDILISGDWQMPVFLQAVAPKYPDKKFFIYDASVDYSVCECGNVYSVLYKQNEGSYLAGYYAGLMTETGIIGVVGGMDIPVINDFIVGYKQGAMNAGAENVFVQYAGSWNDPAKGKELALAMYQLGADIVFQVAGSTGVGVFQAAEEMGKWAIGVDSDQALIVEDFSQINSAVILTSMMKNVDNSLYRALKLHTEGTLPYGYAEFLGVAEGGVGLAYNKYYEEATPEEVKAKIEQIESDLRKGNIAVDTVFK